MHTPDYRELAERTSDAYSYSSYGRNEWASCTMMLMERGYDERETEAILRSKWTRWAADSASTVHPTAGDLARFLDDPRNKCTPASVYDLVVGTFGIRDASPKQLS